MHHHHDVSEWNTNRDCVSPLTLTRTFILAVDDCAVSDTDMHSRSVLCPDPKVNATMAAGHPRMRQLSANNALTRTVSSTSAAVAVRSGAMAPLSSAFICALG